MVSKGLRHSFDSFKWKFLFDKYLFTIISDTWKKLIFPPNLSRWTLQCSLTSLKQADAEYTFKKKKKGPTDWSLNPSSPPINPGMTQFS